MPFVLRSLCKYWLYFGLLVISLLPNTRLFYQLFEASRKRTRHQQSFIFHLALDSIRTHDLPIVSQVLYRWTTAFAGQSNERICVNQSNYKSEGANSQNFLRKFVRFLVTFRCFYNKISHEK